ncbi:NAD(P)H-dependent FMN reductase [Paraburkholderia aspalathi]|uniref:Chromate reductase n=1 Tax=Paraburkholderia aspalathi TaxID=1324617 RepID=A0A1I7AXI6_9BURK|nr:MULTISPECIES: NAD(P)H-dependent oxidoreductase [Paraburkholderia]MCP2084133.1 chromate reductase [Paraburkholderia sediminicola]MBK3819413.1 NAD(P)H-dependent oxidoreductase [Paraburkholderia aspalathi]MBK3831213.1 NAD(P)H-dependent oxidoreductase [Paraburkholderia aspalathi]MBK3860918.1 NAD(P)H-dependent oxidoreductase [Paraburkholderia aspalathi]MCX4138931.1 NAD(P)H-dependent oxidoreductase [Paraburkholderia aspalathi]
MSDRPVLLGISGSLRKASHCTAILKNIVDAAESRATLEIFPLDAVPLYNQDLDNESPPESVTALRQAIERAAGLVIVTPEYNYGMSGVLKNALDWASRPYGKSKLKGKAVLTLSASPAFTGGVRAQAQLNETLLSNAALLVLRPQIVIGMVHEKIRDGRVVDQETARFISEGLNDLLRDIASKATVADQEA